MKKYLLLIGLIVAGSRFARLFNKGSVPDRSVEDIMLEKDSKLAEEQAKRDQFLKATRQIESSGGYDTEHDMMTDGLHAGQRAVGSLGFMPKTIKEMTKRMGDEVPEGLRPITEIKDEQEMADLVAQDPEIEQALADKMYDHLNKRAGGDLEKMNHMWQQGHNMNPDKIAPDVLESHPRTEKFRKLFRKTSGTPE
jgi:hypothetical protein